MNEYAVAATALARVLDDNRHLDDAFEPGTTPLVQQICYGSLRHYYFYCAVIESLIDKPLADKHLDVSLVILGALYSMDHLHRPAHASVNQAVEAAKALKKPWAKGLINAVLRRYGRENEKLRATINSNDREAAHNHPAWLIETIKEDWPDKPEIFTNNNTQAPMTLRVNQQVTHRDAYLEKLNQQGISAHAGTLVSSAIVLDNAVPATALPGFSEGAVSIQDEAPQLAPFFLNLAAGQRVLDACAAPGGKTCHLLETQPDIDLTALDRDKKRVPRISENLERLSLKATVIISELENFSPEHSFDRILLDAPCSATGIIRRHPDIKLLREKSDIDKLSSLQRVLLDKAFDLLAIGGELLYCTCSILRQENDRVIEDFIRDDKRKEIIVLPTLPLVNAAKSQCLVPTPWGLQMLPTEDDHDGFYYCAIRKLDA